jgi:hypothetical protein
LKIVNIFEISLQLSAISNSLDDEQLLALLTLSSILTTDHLNPNVKEVREGATTPLELEKGGLLA